MWPMLGFFPGGPSFCAVTGSVGVLCWVAFLVIAVGTSLLLVTVNIFILHLCMAHLEYLHLTRASLRCCKSSLKSSRPVQTFCPVGESTYDTILGRKIMMTIPHCKYWSVWLGLQYTEMERELSASGLTKVSRKGMAPFS